MKSIYYEKSSGQIMKIIKNARFLLIFLFILISAVDATANSYYVLPDKSRNLKIYTLIIVLLSLLLEILNVHFTTLLSSENCDSLVIKIMSNVDKSLTSKRQSL